MSALTPEQEAFASLLGAAEDRSWREPWIDSLSIAAGSDRELIADERGVCGVRRRRDDVECGASEAGLDPRAWVS